MLRLLFLNISMLMALSGISYASSFNLLRKNRIIVDKSEDLVVLTAIDIFKSDYIVQVVICNLIIQNCG